MPLSLRIPTKKEDMIRKAAIKAGKIKPIRTYLALRRKTVQN